MNIYKQNDIKRLAGKLLTKDFINNEKFHFTNASYGRCGEVMGTIEAHDKKGEHLIQYALVHKNWNDENYDLVRATEDKYWKTETTEYKKLEDEQLIQRFYKVSRDSNDYAVYTDDVNYAKQSQKTRSNRWSLQNRKPTKRTYELEGNHPVKPGTPLYNKLFTWIATKTGKQIKYGSELELSVLKYPNKCDYNWHDSIKKTGTEIKVCVQVMYRNKWLSERKSITFITEKVEKF